MLHAYASSSISLHDGNLQLNARPDTGTDRDLDRMLKRSKPPLGATGLRVVRFIDQNRQIVLASSAAALGERIGTSDATVLRTVQALGFPSLADLKTAILRSGERSTPAEDMRRTLADLDKIFCVHRGGHPASGRSARSPD